MTEKAKSNSARLTSMEERILEIEESWWTIAPTKDRAINAQLGISPMRYYILLSRMLDDERVWRARPQLIDRLRMLREERASERKLS